MARLLKCYGQECVDNNIKHPKEDLIEYKSKRYCESCYEKIKKETEEREDLYHYVKQAYGISFVTPLMKKHIKEMHTQNGWSYKRIKVLIHYVIEIEKNIIDEKYGLRFYSNYYHSMIKYYRELNNRKKQSKNVEIKTKTIVIDSEHFNNNKFKNDKLFDMEED